MSVAQTARYTVPPDRDAGADAARRPSSRLWAAVNLPALTLEALAIEAGEYAVVTEFSRRGEIICAASEKARSASIQPGMHINAALAVYGGLRTHPRDPAAERACLRGLQHWAGRFTPTVTAEPPAMLLFEISASLRLFGGARALFDRLRRELGCSGHRCCLAVAPTPGASSVLASAGREVLITDRDGIKTSMHGLPARFLGFTADTTRRLQAAGVWFMEELWRLPHHDLARRFGPEVVRKLQQVLGEHPDPRRTDLTPARFQRFCELESETADMGLVLRVTRLMLDEFAGFLASGNAGAADIQVLLEHERKPATRIPVRTRLPMRDADQWERLLREHIGRRELYAPVTGIRLSGCAARDATPAHGDLFQPWDASREWAGVLDELEARLGKCLWTPEVAADHRPERAWRSSSPGCAASVTPGRGPDRPLWLLRAPLCLGSPDSPVPGAGSLDIVGGPERIEAGWWDDNEYCRDYYTAVCPYGRRLWIFRDLKQGSGWYLHGLFG